MHKENIFSFFPIFYLCNYHLNYFHHLKNNGLPRLLLLSIPHQTLEKLLYFYFFKVVQNNIKLLKKRSIYLYYLDIFSNKDLRDPSNQ